MSAMETVLECDIPHFVKASPYLQSLSSNGPFPEEGIEVPKGCAKQELNVNNSSDLIDLLQTLRFWMVPEVLETCVEFMRLAFDPQNESMLNECAVEYEQTIPFVSFVHACTDVQKMQMAIEHDSVLLIDFLYEECKVEVNQRFLMAATGGSLGCLKCFIDADGPGFINQYDEILELASREGHLHIIEYMWVEHGSLRTNQSEQHVVHGAAEQGHKSILEFARIQLFSYFDNPTSFNELCYRPHVHTLAYLYDVGQVPGREVLSDAVNNRNIDAVVLLLEHGCPATLDNDTNAYLMHHSGAEAIRAFAAGLPVNERTCIDAAWIGRLECLQWLHEHDCPWDHRTCRDAAQRGHLDCLQYAYEQGCLWSDSIAADAAEATTVHCLQFVLKRGAALTADTFLHAAKSAVVSVFEYLLALHCPCDAHTCAALISASKSFQTTFHDRWKCLRLLHESGCIWDEETCRQANTRECYEYAVARGCPGPALNQL